MSSRSRFTISRRALAGFGALSLAALGLTAVTTTAQAAVVKQVVVSASVDGGTATAGVVSTVNISIANAARIDDFHKFTIVLPPGISAPPGKISPTALGISGGGNWSESVTTCGTVPNCSWLVVGKALLPRATSKVRPGATLTASIGLVADAPGTLSFKVIHVEDDDFSVLGTPTITVVGGVAGAFCITDTTPGNIVAGATKTFTVQAIAAGSFAADAAPCTGRHTAYVGTKLVRVRFVSDDGLTGDPRINAVAPVTGSGDGTATVATPTTPSDVIFNFSSSTSGQFTFTGRFLTAAHNQSLQATEVSPGTVDGNSGGFDVDPGTLAGVVLTSVLDHAHPVAPIDPAAVALTAGAQFDATFFGTDSFGNPVDVAAGLVTLNVGGSGKFTPVAPSSASSASLAVEGVISGSYDSAGTALPISLTLAGATLPTNSLPADFAGTNIGSGFFVPGGAGTIQTSNFALNPDGTPNCVFGTTNPACVGVSLPNGAKGQVTLALEDCATAGALSVGACNFGTAASPGNVVAHLTAELKQADGITPLYTYGAPASLTYVCSLANCPWDPTNDDGSTIYNKWEESVESYADYPLHAQDGSTPNAQFYLVPPCQSLTAGEPAHPATTVPALGEKSCVDVKTLLRDVNPNSPSYGSLTFNILYYDDYKMVP